MEREKREKKQSGEGEPAPMGLSLVVIATLSGQIYKERGEKKKNQQRRERNEKEDKSVLFCSTHSRCKKQFLPKVDKHPFNFLLCFLLKGGGREGERW